MDDTIRNSVIRRDQAPIVEQELSTSVAWFVRIRWLAGLGVLVSTWVSTSLLAISVPPLPLYAIGVGILAYNAGFQVLLRRSLREGPDRVHQFRHNARWQMAADYLAMTALIHFSGGLESPAMLYFIFHIIIAAILLSPRATYLYATGAVLLVTATTGLEYAGAVPHVHVPEFAVTELYQVPTYILGKLFFFISTVYVAAYLAATLNSRLRSRESEVFELSRGLQAAYGRLETLYENAQAANSTLELRQVLDRLAQGTAAAMGIRACSIRLLDDTGTRLYVAAAHGLSESYVKKGDLILDLNPLAREVLSGKTIVTDDIQTDRLLQYPAEAAAEGIRSIISAPLLDKGVPLGLIRAYSSSSHHFTQSDATFLSAIASQGSIAIANALAYQELGKLDQSKSRFVLTVTHELRSPVSVIRSLLRTMAAGYTGELSEEQRDMVARALRRADFLQNLIDDLLDLAAGKSDLGLAEERVELRLDQAVERVLKQFEVSAREKRVQLDWYCAPDDRLITISATPDGMDHILGNLVSNAIKYTPAGGCVRLSMARVEGDVHLEIADSGIGIPPDAVPHLFEEFYRAPNAKSMEKEGTGLGLAITKDLVTRYNGRLTVQSQVGHGTTFTLILPLVRE